MKNIDTIDLTHNDKEEIKFPYLVFRLENKYYAINCGIVSGIMKLPEYITPPSSSQYVKGIFELRGEFIPLVALRALFNIVEIEAERDQFSNIMDMRINDHLNWVNELRHCAENNEPFTLGINPHKCMLGKWLDNYKTDFNSIQVQLNKITDPHAALHASSQSLIDKLTDIEPEDRQNIIDEFFVNLENEYVSKIVNILEQMKHLHGDSLLEMVVVLENNGKHLSIIADEIISVEDMPTEYSTDNMQSEYIAGIRKSSGLDTEVLVIDDAVLIDRILSII